MPDQLSRIDLLCPVHGRSIDSLCITYCGAKNLPRRGMVDGESPSQPKEFGGHMKHPGAVGPTEESEG